jgi:hypothetical protein
MKEKTSRKESLSWAFAVLSDQRARFDEVKYTGSPSFMKKNSSVVQNLEGGLVPRD